MSGISSTPGLNVSDMFNTSLDKVSQKGQALTEKMSSVMSGEKVSTEQMLALQFQVGQYNAMMESISTVTKSMTDLLKSLAQRSS